MAYDGADNDGLDGDGTSRRGKSSVSGGVPATSSFMNVESPTNVAPICSGRSKPTSLRRDCSDGVCQGARICASGTGPVACFVPTIIRSNGVAFQSEQSAKTSQKARRIVSTSVPGSGRATGSQYVVTPPSARRL